MNELQFKGYVTPDDCGGDLRAALSIATELDIRKVVVDRDHSVVGPVYVPQGMYIVIRGCTLAADLVFDGGENYSFCKKWLTIEGENGVLRGNMQVFNAAHVTLTDLRVEGSLSCEYVNWGSIYNVAVSCGDVTVGRGCNNFIIRNVHGEALRISGDHSCGRIVPGSKPEVTNIIVKHCCGQVVLTAAADCGLLNVQADHIEGDVIVGDPAQTLPAEQFMNLTLTDLTGQLRLLNPVKHAYVQ